jgi:hypothetical protein
VVKSGYVDLQTKAVFIDATVYNADKELGFYIRLLVEVGTVGGCTSSHNFFKLPKNFAQLADSRVESHAWWELLLFLMYCVNMCVEIRSIFHAETERLYLTIGQGTKDGHTRKCLQGTQALFEGGDARRKAFRIAAMYTQAHTKIMTKVMPNDNVLTVLTVLTIHYAHSTQGDAQ